MFCFISTTSMKNHIHSKLRSFIIILYIVSFNLASLCRGEEIQLNEMTKPHPWADDRCLRIRRSHNATGVQEVGTLGFKQYIAMRQWPQVLHGTQTLRSKNHLPLGWIVFFHIGVQLISLTLTLCRRDFGMWCSFPSRKRSVYHRTSPLVDETLHWHLYPTA